MNNAVLELQKRAKALERAFNKVRPKQLNSQEIKNDIRSFVQYYFRDFRASYMQNGKFEDDLVETDTYMQDILRCAQKRTLMSVCKRTIKEINTALHELEMKIIMPALSEKGITLGDIRYSKVLDTLRKINSSAAISYEQALKDLNDNSRKSWRGTAVEFREALREVLDALAPDEDVKAQSGFKLEIDTKGPTMKQKTVFILKARQAAQNQIKPLTDAINIVEELIGRFIRSVYERSSVATHTHTSKDEAFKIRDYVTLALIELLEVRT